MDDDGQTDVAQRLNARIANSGGSTYKGGDNKGLIVRAPDFFDSGGNEKVLPATFWHNDIYAPSQMYPSISSPWCPNNAWDGFFISTSCEAGDPGPWEYATVAVVMSDAMQSMFYDFDKIQDTDWGWGVFFATDANSVDKRCLYRDDWGGYDCPGHYIDFNSGEISDDDTKFGSGAYTSGNPDTDQGGGGGSGCHFDNAIDQPDSDDPNGNLVSDANCQCNYEYSGQWSKWVDAWSYHSKQKPGFENRNWLNSNGKLAPAWAVDTGACWVNNPRDLIDLQNALHWLHSNWNNQLIPTSDWDSMQSSELRKYWGWNEIPVSKLVANDPQQWDAIIIKLPADTCQNGDWGKQDDPSCLSDAAQQQLEQDLDDYVKNGKLLLGADNIAKRPGSYMLFVREYGTTFGSQATNDFGVNWAREFFCANWVSPSKKYSVIYGNPGTGSTCYVDSSAPSPAPTTTPAPTPTPPPTPPTPTPPTPTPAPTPPVPSIHGIKNFGHVCLQAEQTPANGQAVTVEYCNGSQQQDWNFDYDKNAITYKDFCMDATDMATGTHLILWECNGMVQQHWDVHVQKHSWHDLASLSCNGKCLDVWTNSKTDEKGLWIWDCNGHDNQKWELPPTTWATV